MAERMGARVRRALHVLTAPPTAEPVGELPAPPDVPSDLVPLLRELGGALISSGQAVGDIEHQLAQIAEAYGADQVRVIVLPTGVFIQLETASGTTSDFTGPETTATLPLHQIGALDDLVRHLLTGDADLAASRLRLRKVLAMPRRFGPLLMVVGHALLTLGFGLILYPAVRAIPVYLGLGAAVGALRLLGARWPTLGSALPVVAAFLVTLASTTFLADWVHGDPLQLLAPALVSFLPGAVLTVAAMELTGNQVVAGASRLVYGIAQLLLLAFGVVAAITVVGPMRMSAVATAEFGWWAAWVGVLMVAVGHRFFSSPPRGTFWWLLLALYSAFVAQAVGQALLTPQLSGFIGALAIAPVAQAIARARTGPPAVVTMLPAFWLLVPGALAFTSLSEIATGVSFGLEDLVSTVLALFSIALGTIVGTALTRDVRHATRAVVRAVRPGDE